jgi:hypothetical protein
VRAIFRAAAPPILVAASALIAAFWVAICAAAPEFIWQGLWLALHHVTRTELLSALLVGFVLAFFVEPLMERLRGLRHGYPGSRTSGSALFTAALSLAFALASIALHDAITAFVSEHEQAAHGGLAEAISLTMAWAIVPFAVTLAWLCRPNRWLAIPVGIIAAVSPCIAGWLFAWPLHSVFTTAVPSLVILGLGYGQMAPQPARIGLARHVRTVAWVAIVWLPTALLVDLLLGWFRLDQFKLYSSFNFWMDARFYLGWSLGLLLAPSPYRSAAEGRSD